MGVLDRHAESLAADLRRRLLERRRAEAAAGHASGESLDAAVAELVDEVAAPLSEERREVVRELILRDTVGLGPLEELLADPTVEEVMVNGHERVYVERGVGSSERRSGSNPSARSGMRSSASSHRWVAASTS